MPKYRKKPVIIEAVRLTDRIIDAEQPSSDHWPGVTFYPIERYALIRTLEGTMRADIGDWIIKGIKGELYPCKPDIFEATYDPI